MICVFRFLIEQGANLAAVNNEGELAIDLADGDEMEELISEEMDKKGGSMNSLLQCENYLHSRTDVLCAKCTQLLQNTTVEQKLLGPYVSNT